MFEYIVGGVVAYFFYTQYSYFQAQYINAVSKNPSSPENISAQAEREARRRGPQYSNKDTYINDDMQLVATYYNADPGEFVDYIVPQIGKNQLADDLQYKGPSYNFETDNLATEQLRPMYGYTIDPLPDRQERKLYSMF